MPLRRVSFLKEPDLDILGVRHASVGRIAELKTERVLAVAAKVGPLVRLATPTDDLQYFFQRFRELVEADVVLDRVRGVEVNPHQDFILAGFDLTVVQHVS